MMLRKRNSKFTIMAVGAKGCGKSSLFNNIVARPIVTSKGQGEIDVYMLNLDGMGASQSIVFVDTPGFGSVMDDDGIQESIIDYIKEQLDLFIEEESRIRRNPRYDDTRVHCLLYFVPATGNGLKQRDVVFLRRAQDLVNVVPVISKADALTDSEVLAMRRLVTEQLAFYGIRMFDFDDAEYVTNGASNISSEMPLAVICGDRFDGSDRVRFHPAGEISLDNPSISDLSVLREILLGSHMDLMMEKTCSDIYEKYRTDALESALNQK